MNKTAVKKDKEISWIYFHFLIVFLLQFFFGYLRPFGTVTQQGMVILGIFLGALYGWITTSNLFIPSMLGIIAMTIQGVASLGEIYVAGFGTESFVFLLFVLVYTGLIESTGLNEFIVNYFVTRKVIQGRPWMFSFFILLATFIVSSFVSTFAALILLLVCFKGVCTKYGFKPHSPYVTFMFAAITMSAIIGMVTLPFKPTPLMLFGIYQNVAGIEINYVSYTIFTFIMSLLAMGLVIGIGKFVFRFNLEALKELRVENVTMSLNKKQKIVVLSLVIFIVALFLPSILPAQWGLTIKLKLLNSSGITILMLLILMLIRVDEQPLMNFREMAAKGISWDILAVSAFLMPLSGYLMAESAGIKALFVTCLGPILMGRATFVFFALIVIVAILLTNFSNNAVIAIILLAMAPALCQEMGVSSVAAAVLIVYSTSIAFLTPAACPVAAVTFGMTDWVGKEIYQYTATLLVALMIIMVLIGVPLAICLF